MFDEIYKSYFDMSFAQNGLYETIIPEINCSESVPDIIIGDMIPHEMIPHEMIPHEMISYEMIPHDMFLHDMFLHDIIPQEMIPQEIIPGETNHCETIPDEIIPDIIRIKDPRKIKKVICGPHRKLNGNYLPSFIYLLWKIINEESCCEWTNNGMMFSIINLKQFEKILPKYFKHSNFTSFKRQLNYYNFEKKYCGPLVWQNKYFQENNIKLLSKINRKKY